MSNSDNKINKNTIKKLNLDDCKFRYFSKDVNNKVN
jgi:hypothetical protein